MIWIPGRLIAWITFPGTVVHTFAWHLSCDLASVEVYGADYLRGRVLHGPIPSIGCALLIACSPLVVNTLLCMALLLPYGGLESIGSEGVPLYIVVLNWLGLSVGMHAFPSRQEFEHYWDAAPTASASRSLRMLARAIGALFAIVFFLKRLWFDFFYAVLVGAILPWAILKNLATLG